MIGGEVDCEAQRDNAQRAMIATNRMRLDVRAKLQEEISQPILSERQVVYILVETRKLVDLTGKGRAFAKLGFCCDWALHTTMSWKVAKELLCELDSEFDNLLSTTQETFEKSLARIAVKDPLLELQTELEGFLRSEGLDTSRLRNRASWTTFLSNYVGVIEDCPIVYKDQQNALKHLESMTVKKVDVPDKDQSTSGVDLFLFGAERSFVLKHDRFSLTLTSYFSIPTDTEAASDLRVACTKISYEGDQSPFAESR